MTVFRSITTPNRVALPAPCDMGAPSVYTSWWGGQDRAMERLLASQKRFKVLALPTGVGKSLVAMVHAVFGDKRTVILTSTKGLQDQYRRDYAGAGLIDVRGMNNYPCLELSRGNCDEGPCLDGLVCSKRDRGCFYYDAVRVARKARLVVTNYAFWMTQKTLAEGGLGPVDLLVLDEAHEVPDEVSDFMRVELGRQDVGGFPPEADELELEGWRRWATPEAARWRSVVSQMQRGNARRRIQKTVDRLEALAAAGDDWVAARARDGWTWEPLWPMQYAESWLWGDIKEVVFASATVRPKTLLQLGLKPADYDWIECPSPFPVGRRPVLHIPTIQMKHRNTDGGNLGIWVDRIDQVIEGRLDRKGIIHTVSYDRARYLVQNSQFRDLMLVHDSKSRQETVEAFKRSAAPCILVSPSVHTGYDFPYGQTLYQIIGKVPWPDTRSAVMQARCAQDPSYAAYSALTTLVQMAGRGMRAPDDYCETFITDDNVRWMMGRFREFVPAWFREAYRSVQQIPRPVPLAVALRAT